MPGTRSSRGHGHALAGFRPPCRENGGSDASPRLAPRHARWDGASPTGTGSQEP
jgi:hypothetical protein